MEGWITQRGDPRVSTPGSQLHNRVHLYIGGNMAPMTSPNDPVFFLHHCFIDEVWDDWQVRLSWHLRHRLCTEIAIRIE